MCLQMEVSVKSGNILTILGVYYESFILRGTHVFTFRFYFYLLQKHKLPSCLTIRGKPNLSNNAGSWLIYMPNFSTLADWKYPNNFNNSMRKGG